MAPQATSAALSPPSQARGLAIDIEDGVGVPLTVRAGQTFWVNQVDLRAAITATVDEGVSGLSTQGAAASLNWTGVQQEEQEFVDLPNPDGTWTLRRFFRDAQWMDVRSSFEIAQLDAAGNLTAAPITVGTGRANHLSDKDDFFIRRLRAIQWVNNCASPVDCSAANSFLEEALVEIRDQQHPERTFTFAAATTQLRVTWSLDAQHPYLVPVTQDPFPPFDYGFDIQLASLTPPNPDGTYSAGQSITYELTLTDGSSNRLHPPGLLPSYFDATFGPNPAGISYYRGFIDPAAAYYRRKHRERDFVASITGPLQNVQPIRSIVGVDQLFAPALEMGSISRDGVFGEAVIFPQGLFAGAFDPAHTEWFAPSSDIFTFHLPLDAPAGTYDITVKSRRAYEGEDLPVTKTIEIQVGTTQVTQATLNTGGCDDCHSGQTSLGVVNHANADRATCTTCHAPQQIEIEGPVYVLAHFIHSRSGRFDSPLTKCSTCHLTQASIQRTSKSACLSCHTSYPQSHVEQFGPITSMYVGGGSESFIQCTDACHTNHPGSGL
jgi:hypothetical protein